MPKVTMLFAKSSCSKEPNTKILEELGQAIKALVAEAFSTEKVKLDPIKDIDWLPMPYPPGSQVYYPMSIEIATIGYPERKKKVTEEVLRTLKTHIRMILRKSDFMWIDTKWPLIWVHYTDPDGMHI